MSVCHTILTCSLQLHEIIATLISMSLQCINLRLGHWSAVSSKGVYSRIQFLHFLAPVLVSYIVKINKPETCFQRQLLYQLNHHSSPACIYIMQYSCSICMYICSTGVSVYSTEALKEGSIFQMSTHTLH